MRSESVPLYGCVAAAAARSINFRRFFVVVAVFGLAFVPIRDGTRGIELKFLTRWNESESVVDGILVLQAGSSQRRDAFHSNKLLAFFSLEKLSRPDVY